MEKQSNENPSTERFTIEIGKYGAYFYDKKLQEDMTLEAVKNRLNECYKNHE